MFLLLLLTAVWVGGLTMYRPKPESLREKPVPYLTNLVQSKVTLLLGLGSIGVYAITSNQHDTALEMILALNNQTAFGGWTFVQLFTNTFVHFTLVHLLSNLFLLGLLSVYEKRVGGIRFLQVFFVSALFANASILFYSEPVLSAGISAGVAGLMAAYVLDHKNVSARQYLIGFASALLIFTALQLQAYLDIDTENIDIQIDFLGHFFGFIVGALFVRMFTRYDQ